MPKRIWILWPCLGLLATAVPPLVAANDEVAKLQASIPRAPSECTAARRQRIEAAAQDIEQWAAELVWQNQGRGADDVLAHVQQLVEVKDRVNAALDELLQLRMRFSNLEANDPRRETLRQYLRITSQLIDLSGRLRYSLRDAVDNAAYDLEPSLQHFDALIDFMTQRRESIAAEAMTYVLFDPPADGDVEPFPPATKYKVLRLAAAARSQDVLPDLADFIRQQQTPAALLVAAAEVVRYLGLPQDPRPGRDPTLPEPPITARQLHQVLSRLDPARLGPDLTQRRNDLLRWLAERARYGVREDHYRVGNFEVRAGDWLLMRNPSPYNRFTDLSPGLFTHVGVVGIEQDANGLRRFVIVDLPERGDRVPATNVETYLRRTLHFFFLRHEDPAVGRRMGEVAVELIGNETQFDLMFRTDRVAQLRGQPLKGTRIHTYCAGLLLICAQETTAPREEFFPIAEYPAGARCLENLQQLGLSIGDDFVSPTGALFSRQLQIAGRRDPMYHPGREIKEAVFDHFAEGMIHRRLTPSPDAFQALRQKIAGLSKYNPWLARALAQANNVSQHMDLEAAAKAAAVIETLDEIADANQQAFLEAHRALTAAAPERLAGGQIAAEQIERIRQLRQHHDDLFRQWTARQLTPRQLRIQLVEYYKLRGEKDLDQRFFRAAQ